MLLGQRWRPAAPTMSRISIAASGSASSSATAPAAATTFMPACSGASSASISPASPIVSAAEHAGRRQPRAPPTGSTTWRPKDGTVIATLEPDDADRPGARPARHSVRRAQVQLDRQHRGGQQHPVRVRRVAASPRSMRPSARRSRSAPPARARLRCSIRRSPNNLLGTKFRIVSGYPGGGDINLAVERREVDGRGSDSWASLKSTHPDWLRDHKINILFQVGPKREAGSARRAAVERTRRHRRAAPDARHPVRRRGGRAADPDGAGCSGRSGEGVAPGVRRYARRSGNSSKRPSRPTCTSIRWVARSCSRS